MLWSFADMQRQFDLVEHARLYGVIIDLLERRQLAVEIFIDHRAARRHAIDERRQELAPVRQAGIGDGAHQHPMIRRFDREHLGDKLFGARWIVAEHAGDEADIGPGALRVLEGLHGAERVHHFRQLVGIGAVPISVDPAQDHGRRIERGRGRLRRHCRRRHDEETQCNDESGCNARTGANPKCRNHEPSSTNSGSA